MSAAKASTTYQIRLDGDDGRPFSEGDTLISYAQRYLDYIGDDRRLIAVNTFTVYNDITVRVAGGSECREPSRTQEWIEFETSGDISDPLDPSNFVYDTGAVLYPNSVDPEPYSLSTVPRGELPPGAKTYQFEVESTWKGSHDHDDIVGEARDLLDARRIKGDILGVYPFNGQVNGEGRGYLRVIVQVEPVESDDECCGGIGCGGQGDSGDEACGSDDQTKNEWWLGTSFCGCDCEEVPLSPEERDAIGGNRRAPYTLDHATATIGTIKLTPRYGVDPEFERPLSVPCPGCCDENRGSDQNYYITGDQNHYITVEGDGAQAGPGPFVFGDDACRVLSEAVGERVVQILRENGLLEPLEGQ